MDNHYLPFEVGSWTVILIPGGGDPSGCIISMRQFTGSSDRSNQKGLGEANSVSKRKEDVLNGFCWDSISFLSFNIFLETVPKVWRSRLKRSYLEVEEVQPECTAAGVEFGKGTCEKR